MYSSNNNGSSRCLLGRIRFQISFLTMLVALMAVCGQTAFSNTSYSFAVPNAAMLREAHLVGPQPGETPMTVAVTLPFRNQAELDDVVRRLYDPKDPLYGKYLSSAEFAQRFGPSQADHNDVAAFARTHGLTVQDDAPGRSVMSLSGSSADVEKAFGVKLNNYVLPSGRVAYANAGAPTVPAGLEGKISAIIGLDNLVKPHHHVVRRDLSASLATPLLIGSGAQGGLSPTDIKAAYNLTNINGLDGTGQKVALMELDGYLSGDIPVYTNKYNLGTANLTNILTGGFTGVPGVDGVEVTLDIDMICALAPRTNILVYEASNDAGALVTLFDKIASDNSAPVVSCSWGLPETFVPTADLAAENGVFTRMVAQGQTVYCSSGDNGAFDDPNSNTAVVDDPASQPDVVAVGGTKLSVTAPGGTWTGETTWATPSDRSGGGGGFSTKWPKPAYQGTLGISKTNRNVPDVSLDADPETGYSIYYTGPGSESGGYSVVGGTSAAAPLWAAFEALVNQQRIARGIGLLGFANQQIYPIANSPAYPVDFHDINDGSNNLLYKATAGYDDATGWGSFIGSALLNDLSPVSGGPPGTLAGMVIDDTGGPIAGAAVAAYIDTSPLPFRSTVTDSKGAYSLLLPSALTYTLLASAPTYAGESISNFSMPPNVTVAQNFTLSLGHVFGSTGIQMISAPYDYRSVEGFGALLGFTPPQATDPVLVTWEAFVLRYVRGPAAPADTLRLGQGYWVRIPSTSNPLYITRQGAPAPANQPFRIVLQQGWNQIGDPFTDDVNLSSLLVDTLDPATPDAPVGIADQQMVRPIFWGFDQSAFAAGNYPYVKNDLTGVIHPWQGYWVFAATPAVLVVPPPGPPNIPGPPPVPL